jgi:acyl-CoA thioesterase
VADALFEREGDHYRPTDLSRGPWDPDALHGGPVAALVAGAVEDCVPPAEGFQVARLTVELVRPVPVAPLSVRARTTRPGRKIRLVEVSVAAGDVEVTRAVALLIRSTSLSLPGPPPAEEVVAPPERGVASATIRDAYVGFHNGAVDMAFVAGGFAEAGPATVWVRLRQPVVAGEPPSPLQRVAAAADFGNGVSRELDFGRWLFINPDLTIYLRRYPEGEWVCLDARTRNADTGMGLAESALYDERGLIGRSLQALLVEPTG